MTERRLWDAATGECWATMRFNRPALGCACLLNAGGVAIAGARGLRQHYVYESVPVTGDMWTRRRLSRSLGRQRGAARRSAEAARSDRACAAY
jgi:hypothetical protein